MAKLQFGLGINFVANTGKFIKAIDGASRSLRRMYKDTEDVEKANKSFFDRLSETKTFKKFSESVSKISSSVDSLTGGLSSQLNKYVSLNKEISEVTAGMGLVGKESQVLKKAMTGLNLGYAISIDNVAKLVTMLKQSGIDITNNAEKIREYAKYMEGLQVSPDVIASFFSYGKSINLTEKQIMSLLDTATALGKEIADVPTAVSAFPEVMMNVIESTQSFADEFKRAGISYEEYTKRIVMGAIAFGKATGKGFDAGADAMNKLVETFFSAREEFAKFRAGVEGAEISKELVELGIITGDVGESFEMMKKDPLMFIKTMSDMVSKLRELGRMKSLEVLRTRINETFGEDFTRTIFDNADAFSSSIKSMNNAIKGSEGMAKKVTQATLGTTGRTLEALQAQLDYQIGQLKAKALPYIIKALKIFNKYVGKITKFLDDIGKRSPKIGSLLDKIIAFTEIGVSGFFAMTPVIFPVIMGLQSLVMVGGELASGFKFLFGLINGGIKMFGNFGKTIGSLLPFGKLFTGILSKIFFWVGLIIASIKPLMNLFEKLNKIWGDKTKSAGDKVIEIFNAVIKTLWDIFNNFFFGIPQKIAEMLGLAEPSQKVADKTVKTKKKVFKLEKSDIKTASIFSGEMFLSTIDYVAKVLIKTFNSVLDNINKWWSRNRIVIYDWISNIMNKISDWVLSAVDKVLPFVVSILDSIVDFILKIDWYSVLNGLFVWFSNVVEFGFNLFKKLVFSWLPFLGIKLLKLGIKLFIGISIGIIKWWVKNVVSRIISFIWTFIKTIGKNFIGFITGKITFSEIFEDFSKTYDEVSKKVGKEADKFSEAADLVWDTSRIEKFLDETASWFIKKDEITKENTEAIKENNELLRKSIGKEVKYRKKKTDISISSGLGGIKTEKSISGVASNVSLGTGNFRLKLRTVI